MSSHKEKLDMICVCNKDGEAAAEVLMQEVKERLAGGSEELMKRDPGEADKYFLTWIVQSLHWDFSAEIKGIFTDQWSGVSVADGKNEEYSIWVECDVIEHGLAAAWKHIADIHELAKA